MKITPVELFEKLGIAQRAPHIMGDIDLSAIFVDTAARPQIIAASLSPSTLDDVDEELCYHDGTETIALGFQHSYEDIKLDLVSVRWHGYEGTENFFYREVHNDREAMITEVDLGHDETKLDRLTLLGIEDSISTKGMRGQLLEATCNKINIARKLSALQSFDRVLTASGPR